MCDADLMANTSTCPECGTPRVLTRKFNSGDPKDLWLAACECEEMKTEARLAARYGWTR